MLPTTYKPTCPAQFIGSARQWAEMIDRLVATAEDTPIKVLLNGAPGTGKSSLAQYLADRLDCSKFSMTKVSGTQFNVDLINDLNRSLQYRDLFGGYRLIWIEEADKIPHVAQVRALLFLDDLPRKVAVIATSNVSLKEFEERFQTRFMTMQVEGPQSSELLEFIKRFFSAEQLVSRASVLNQIATFACGNVRQALLDVQTELLA